MGHLYTGDLGALEAALTAEAQAVRERDALAPVTLIVGSAALATYLSWLLAERLGGHANVRAVTIYRFALDLAQRSGLRADHVLTDEARLRLGERVVASVTASPESSFRSLRGMPGLVPAFLRSIEDLREARVPADRPWDGCGERVADVRRALIAYEAALYEADAADRAGVYARAARALRARTPHGSISKCGALVANDDDVLALPAVAFVYGLYDLPECQRELLAALAGVCETTVFLPSPQDGQGYTALGWRFFAGLGLRANALSATAVAAAELVSVGDDEDELTEVARALRRSAGEGRRFHEIAVVAPGEQRAEHIARGLQALGFPVARRLPPSSGGCVSLRSLLEAAFPAAGEAWQRAALLAHAQAMAAAGVLRGDEVARWAEESRQAGVVAGDDWRRLRRQRAAVDGLSVFVGRVQQAVAGLPAVAPWDQMAAAFVRLAHEVCAVSPDDPAVLAITELRRCATVEEAVSVAEAARVIGERLRGVREPCGAVARHGVAVLTPHELRGLRFAEVHFTGLCSGGFPPSRGGDPLLCDRERERLARLFAVHLAEPGGGESEADTLFALARQAALRSFVGYVPRRDAAGAERQPARAAVELAEELTGRTVAAEDFVCPPPAAAGLRRAASGPQPLAGGAVDAVGAPADLRDLDVALLLALSQSARRRGAATAPRRYLERVCGAPAARRLLGRRLSGVSAGALSWDGVFYSRRARQELASTARPTTPQAPTALQQYLECPFAYYVLHVLMIEPLEPADPLVETDRREVGRIVHRVLQRVFSGVRDGAGREEAVSMVPALVAEECRVAEERGALGMPLVWRIEQARMAEDLSLAVAQDPVWAEPEGPRPWLLESVFGEQAPAVSLELPDGRTVSFRGRIDRVDRGADGRRLRVLDYKTGRGRGEQEQVEAGRNVQLPVYRLAVRARAEGRQAADVSCAFRMVTRRRELAEVVLPADEAMVLEQLADTVDGILRLVEAGVFPRLAWNERSCDWCPVAYACDELKLTQRRKRAHPAFGRLAALRRPWSASAAESSSTARQAEGATDA